MLKILNQKKEGNLGWKFRKTEKHHRFLEKSAQNTGNFVWLFDKNEKQQPFFWKKLPKTLNFTKNMELKKNTDSLNS